MPSFLNLSPRSVLHHDLVSGLNSGRHPDPSSLEVSGFFHLLLFCQADAELKTGVLLADAFFKFVKWQWQENILVLTAFWS